MERLLGVMVGLAAMAGCNQHPVSYVPPLAGVEFRQPFEIDPNTKLDMLWVIDNSGSMCQEQNVLRENFDRVVEKLEETGIDFQLGVTTTHMEADSPQEPVARPGHLQSTPQPVAGFDRSCYEAVNERGETIAGDFTPVRQLIDIAVDCMADSDPSYLDVTDDDIRCALGLIEGGECLISGVCGDTTPCSHADLFPPADAYRTLPKVLASESYRDAEGHLDIDGLKRDFACMSTVGVRGSGFEKGLGAAVLAVSPQLTGGAVGAADADPSAPNHGLIRSDARFATVFITDENDCTHDGRLAQQDACGGDICEYWNHPDLEEISPLLSPQQLHDDLLANLSATKGVDELHDGDVMVASIHGSSDRYVGNVVAGPECYANDLSQVPTACGAFDLCQEPGYEEIAPTCQSALGKAKSGDRYSRFLRTFGEGNYFPAPVVGAPESPLTGWMCTGDFRPALTSIAELFRTVPTGCITRPIRTCDGPGASCPAHPHTGDPGTCLPRPNSDEYFCDSYVELRVYDDDETTLNELAETGFCAAASLGDVVNPGSCVVQRARYDFSACTGNISGVKIEWDDLEQARQALAGTTLELRYPGFE